MHCPYINQSMFPWLCAFCPAYYRCLDYSHVFLNVNLVILQMLSQHLRCLPGLFSWIAWHFLQLMTILFLNNSRPPFPTAVVLPSRWTLMVTVLQVFFKSRVLRAVWAQAMLGLCTTELTLNKQEFMSQKLSVKKKQLRRIFRMRCLHVQRMLLKLD